jgi:hypothetical protein
VRERAGTTSVVEMTDPSAVFPTVDAAVPHLAAGGPERDETSGA